MNPVMKMYRGKGSRTINFNGLNELQFKECFRMTSEQAEYILENVGPALQRQTKRSKTLSPNEQLHVCLDWLGNGAQMHGVGQLFAEQSLSS